ncbi:DUF932 domain-containing protein [Thermodesulfobacteriota bacterium]
MNSSADSEISFPKVVEQPVLWGYHEDSQEADKYKAIVDDNTKKLYSVVSKDYRLIRHEDAIEEIEKAILTCPDLGEHEVKTEFYNDGGRMQRVYTFVEVAVQIQDNDLVNPELHLYNSYDVTWPFTVLLGAYRLVCSNGLTIGKTFMQLKKRHTFELEMANCKEQVSTTLDQFNSQTEQWKRWAGRKLTPNISDNVIIKMEFGEKARDEIELRIIQESKDCDDEGFPMISIWAFYNVLTWYITHRHVSLNHRVEMEKRLRGALKELN